MTFPFLLAGAMLAGFSPADSVPLYTDLGTHHMRITARVSKAQQYFDQGLRLTYAFNHAEAIRAFREGARLDPGCAMCWWGAALAAGPHVNAGMDSAAGADAWVSLQKAQAAASRVSPREQAYIRALSRRYGADPLADRAQRDSAYARAMAEVARQFPDDLDAATLYAEALMDLSPWYYYSEGGKPRPDTPTILAQLEKVLGRNPDHPGACHYYIHAVEAVEPEKAVACAERLAGAMPGAGHMVHMPGHIYIRVGRYKDAIHANHHAVHADETYIEGQKPPLGVYPIGYYPHNYHFLAFAATMAGESRTAIEAARKLRKTTPPEVARQVPLAEPYVPYVFLTLVTFGKWDEVLAEPVPPEDLSYSHGLAHYARGVAFAAKGDREGAAAALARLQRTRETMKKDYAIAGWSTPPTVLEIAEYSLRGEMALRGGRAAEAAGHFRKAAELEDGLLYIEPPDWYYPVRHSLGRALIEAGQPAEAEAVFRQDLKRFPRNGWALFGLGQSLKAQGKAEEAARAEAEFSEAWRDADIRLSSARF